MTRNGNYHRALGLIFVSFVFFVVHRTLRQRSRMDAPPLSHEPGSAGILLAVRHRVAIVTGGASGIGSMLFSHANLFRPERCSNHETRE